MSASGSTASKNGNSLTSHSGAHASQSALQVVWHVREMTPAIHHSKNTAAVTTPTSCLGLLRGEHGSPASDDYRYEQIGCPLLTMLDLVLIGLV